MTLIFEEEVLMSSAGKSPWTVQVTWTERDDFNKPFLARSVICVWAEDTPKAYQEAERIVELKPTAKLGAIVPGHLTRLF